MASARNSVVTLLCLLWNVHDGASVCTQPLTPQGQTWRLSCTDEARLRHFEKPHEIEVHPFVRDVNSTDLVNEISSTDAVTEKKETKEEGLCAMNENGSFGFTSATKFLLEYYYEIEYDPNKITNVDRTILIDIEHIVTTFLVSIFANEECSSRGNVIGISGLPQDRIVSGVDCQGEMTLEESSCELVQGQTSLFVTNEGKAANDGSIALDTIQSEMNDGSFNNFLEGIHNVAFVNGTFSIHNGTTTSPDSDQPQKDSGGANGGLPLYSFFLFGLSLAAVVITTIVCKRRKNTSPGANLEEAHARLVPHGSPSSDTYMD